MSRSTLQELRDLNVRKQKEAQSTEVGNMTGHMTDNTDSHTTNQEHSKPGRKPGSKPSRQQASRSSGKSVHDMIVSSVQAAQAAAIRPILKTVTIKLDPALDRRVEDHCYAARRLKQDVVRDALLLYFETIEAAMATVDDAEGGDESYVQAPA